ncbi:HepT-like ribonuclease domain-containing protein [Leucobacter luti]|uniref:HepT-like ribonuclease domain-containing protein n=1 Tax=Leucobacter luti TaxID=340320 RepID=UPI003D044484
MSRNIEQRIADILQAPEIAWPQIRGFRNILVHRYFGVDVDIVRDVIQMHLPVLAACLRQQDP